MARALDRVKAAEAKYEAMAATAEKLEATLKELKSCQWSIDELRRVADREREDENTDFWMFVLMAGIMGVVGGLLGNFFREIVVRILDALGAWWGSWAYAPLWCDMVSTCLPNPRIRAQSLQLLGYPSLCQRTSTTSSNTSLSATASRWPGWSAML